MRIYNSPLNDNRWILQPFRASFKGAGREERIREKAKSLEFRFICVYSQGDTLHAAYTTERDGYDFGSRLNEYCQSVGLKDVVYIERSNNDHNIIVIIRDGEIKKDKLGTKEVITNELKSLMTSSSISGMKLVNYQFLENSLAVEVNTFFTGRIENISAALTDKLAPSDVFAFLPERDAMSKIKSRRPWLLYVTIFTLGLIGAYKLATLSEIKQEKIVAIDPYESFYAAMSTDVIQVLNRMAQDYNVHVGLMTLPGWSVDKVTHTKGQVSFRVWPTENGDLKTLKSFAKVNGLHVLISSNETVLLGRGANIISNSAAQLYDVENVHHFLRDAVNEYIPGAELTFIRDIPKGSSNKWLIRELMFQFTGIYKEDLMTLGSITKNLPISIGGDSNDPNAGQYVIDKERFTGGLKISVFGEKK